MPTLEQSHVSELSQLLVSVIKNSDFDFSKLFSHNNEEESETDQHNPVTVEQFIARLNEMVLSEMHVRDHITMQDEGTGMDEASMVLTGGAQDTAETDQTFRTESSQTEELLRVKKTKKALNRVVKIVSVKASIDSKDSIKEKDEDNANNENTSEVPNIPIGDLICPQYNENSELVGFSLRPKVA